MAMKIYVGKNCHADVVVDGVDRGELGALNEAKELAATTGMPVFPDSFLGHFSIRGAAYGEEGHPVLTPDERVALEQIGEVVELPRIQQDAPLAA
jgi:hypothetical protein